MPEQTMIEKVARAINPSVFEVLDRGPSNSPLWHTASAGAAKALHQARAAIAAMRPTKEMLAADIVLSGLLPDCSNSREILKVAWNAAIDIALSQTHSTSRE